MGTRAIWVAMVLPLAFGCAIQSDRDYIEGRECLVLQNLSGFIQLYELERRSLPRQLSELINDPEYGRYISKASVLDASGNEISYSVGGQPGSFELVGTYWRLEQSGRNLAGCVRK